MTTPPADEPIITLGSGEDGRIVAEFLSIKDKWDYQRSGLPELWLFLARKHRRPIRELKALVETYKRQQNPDRPVRSPAPDRYAERACRCGAVEGIKWTTNPYAVEIFGDYTRMWLCSTCEYELAMDI